MKQEFTDIYTNHIWGDGTTTPLSGEGSALHYTENIIKELPVMFKKFNITSMFDAACGDFNWMSTVLPALASQYIGGDVVEHVIANNIKNYPDYHFIVHDLTTDAIPKVQLLFIRDCLMHLPEYAIKAILHNVKNSSVKYFMATTYLASTLGYWGNKYSGNFDIPIGGFRAVNLFDPPYNLPHNILYRIKDYVPGHPERELCLWSCEQL